MAYQHRSIPWLEGAEAARQRNREIWKRIGEDDSVTRLADKVHGVVHVAGGPCVDSAPEGDEFVLTSEASAFSRINCEKCQVVMAIAKDELGDKNTATADPYARATILTHCADVGIFQPLDAGHAYMTLCKKKAFRVTTWWTNERSGGSGITCGECLARGKVFYRGVTG